MASRDLGPKIVPEGLEQGNPQAEPETSVGRTLEQEAEGIV